MQIPRAEVERMLQAIRLIEEMARRLRCPEENVLMELDKRLAEYEHLRYRARFIEDA